MKATKPNALGIQGSGEPASFHEHFIQDLQKAEVVVMQASTPGKTTTDLITVHGLRKALVMTRGSYGKHGGTRLDIVSVDGVDVQRQVDSVERAFILPWAHRHEYLKLVTQQAGMAPRIFDFNLDKAKQAWFNN